MTLLHASPTSTRLWSRLSSGFWAYVDIYLAQLKVTFAIQLQYRVSAALWLVYTVLEPIIYLTVWSAVARSSGGTVGGFTSNDFAAYFIVTMLVNHLTFTWIMHEFEVGIRQGRFSPRLLKPVHPIHLDIAENITYKVMTSIVIAPAAIILSLLFSPAYNVTVQGLLLAFPALILSFAMRFLFGWALALVAFWTTRVTAINQLYIVTVTFLSGTAVPLALLPDGLRATSWFLPFRWWTAFPSELILGQVPSSQILPGFALQIFWLIVSYFALTLIWRRALRQYTSVGA